MDEKKAGSAPDEGDADIEHLSKAVVRLSNELASVRRELEEAKAQLRNREEQVRVMSLVDRITGLGNPKAFEQALEVEVHRAARYGGPLCLALAAIDGLEGIASHLPQKDRRRASLEAAAGAHAAAALPAVTGEHYEGGHWLGTFAVYLTTQAGLRE